eukprot:EG_transcript_37772
MTSFRLRRPSPPIDRLVKLRTRPHPCGPSKPFLSIPSQIPFAPFHNSWDLLRRRDQGSCQQQKLNKLSPQGTPKRKKFLGKIPELPPPQCPQGRSVTLETMGRGVSI